ncbi:uncharacterized protein [Henckelia pumila]|uniref:uncharacterized protein n=1 Tax=Henckelia pumila TaxID=405737 RepID=UPI003C6DB83C
MAKESSPEPEKNQEFGTPVKPKRRGPRIPHEYEDDPDEQLKKERRINGASLASHKPSYCLMKFGGSSQCEGESLRSRHRKKLRWLVKKLIKARNWTEAGGVLSVLLQGSGRDKSPSRNRAKYWAALELLNYIKDGSINLKKARNVYELWMKKMGSLKNWSERNRFAVQVEFILFCLQNGNMENAHQAALCLMQERGFCNDPVSNLVVGMVFYQLWYSGIPKELQLTELDSSGTFMQSNTFMGGMHMSINNSMEDDGLEFRGAESPLRGDSNSSVANNKEAFEENGNRIKEEPMEIDEKLGEDISHPNLQSQGFYMNSVKVSEQRDYSFSNDSDDQPHASIFYTQGLPPWLLPLKLPDSHENLEDAMQMHKKLRTDFYTSSVNCLRVALYSTPPVIEAFHPLIQMLLLGDQVGEALGEVENMSKFSDSIVHRRLKAGLVEHFDGENYVKLCTCFEEILKKDPTCGDSLAKLFLLHQRGEYNIHNLVEMIALHLDATYGTCDTWKELASCFLKLSQCEEDRISMCGDDGDQCSREFMGHSNKIPEIFTDSESGKSWRFRFRWWERRHFNNSILKSDMTSGDLQRLTYKAAAASHIYGRDFRYVAKTIEYLEKEADMEMYALLQTHVLNSVGFYKAENGNSL